jgi:hypothetical protein
MKEGFSFFTTLLDLLIFFCFLSKTFEVGMIGKRKYRKKIAKNIEKIAKK